MESVKEPPLKTDHPEAASDEGELVRSLESSYFLAFNKDC